MKPYGKKNDKYSGGHDSNQCSICSNDEWKITKSRERHNLEEVNDFLNSEEITAYDELEKTIQVYLEDDNIFRACSNIHEMDAIAIDPDEAIEKLAHKIYKQL